MKIVLSLLFGIAGLLMLGRASANEIVLNSWEYYKTQEKEPIAVIRKQATQENQDAILTLGIINDRPSVPFLEHLAETPVLTDQELINKYPNRQKSRNLGTLKENSRRIRQSASVAAKMALTRMGARSYFDEFVVGLTTSSYEWKTTCIYALGYSGDKRALKFLGPMLTDKSDPPVPLGRDEDVAVVPYGSTSEAAIKFLMSDDERAAFQKEVMSDPEASRHWWERNKDKYIK